MGADEGMAATAASSASDDSLGSVADLLTQAAQAEKCRACGCAHTAAAAIGAAAGIPVDVRAATEVLTARFVVERYECLGCSTCWPAEALGLLGNAGIVDVTAACPSGPVEERSGWPPLPGDYTVLRFGAPVAVCTLGDRTLAEAIATAAGEEIAIVGTLATENLGLERLIANVVSNPNLRFVILAGDEPRQAVGHRPGGSLLALAANGIGDDDRIVGAPGRRPVLTNIDRSLVAHFVPVIEVIDLIGNRDPADILAAARGCAARSPGPIDAAEIGSAVTPTDGYLRARMVPDPAGYFVVYPDHVRRELALEHYTNAGVLDAVVTGPTAPHCYTAAIEAALLSRLDHAAYLGRELARAEHALETGARYVQDAAPEASTSPTRAHDTCSDGGCGSDLPR